MRASVLLVYVAVSFLWGSTWSVIRVGLADLPPLLFAGLRMAIAAAILAPLAFRAGAWRGIGAPLGRRIAFVGILQIALPYGLMFVAQQWVPSALAAILFATFPIWIALLAAWLLPGERLGAATAASAALGIAGIVLLQARQVTSIEASPRLALGSALIVAASIVVALANVMVKRHLLAVSPLLMTAGQTAVGAFALLAAAAVFERRGPVAFTAPAVAALVYLAVFATAITYVGLYWLVSRVPMAALGAIPLLDTSVAVLLGSVLLDEPVGWPLAVGGALVLAAAALANRPAAPARGASGGEPAAHIT